MLYPLSKAWTQAAKTRATSRGPNSKRQELAETTTIVRLAKATIEGSHSVGPATVFFKFAVKQVKGLVVGTDPESVVQIASNASQAVPGRLDWMSQSVKHVGGPVQIRVEFELLQAGVPRPL